MNEEKEELEAGELEENRIRTKTLVILQTSDLRPWTMTAVSRTKV